jgi:hypothetical protein
MAQADFSIDITQAKFPLNPGDNPRTVINPAQGEKPAPVGVIYAENIMPTSTGFSSVYFQHVALPINPAGAGGYSQIFPFVTMQKTPVYVAFNRYRGAAGNLTQVLRYNSGLSASWLAANDTTPSVSGTSAYIPYNNEVSVAKVDGIGYMAVAGVGVFKLSIPIGLGTREWVHVPLTGIVAANIVSIASISGYLLVFTVDSVAWSSTIDPTDFTPSAVTGAGGGSIAELRGDVRLTTPLADGVAIFSSVNAVSMTYTGNKAYPFKLREIPGSLGALSVCMTTRFSNVAQQFVYNAAGIQAVTPEGAEAVLPELTEFLSSGYTTGYDLASDEFTSEVLSDSSILYKKLTLVAGRFIVISYGSDNTTYYPIFEGAIIYDTLLARAGRITLTHTSAFDYQIVDPDGIFLSLTDAANRSIAFMLDTGEIKVLGWGAHPPTAAYGNQDKLEAVIILGSLQDRRTRNITLHEVEIQNQKLFPLDGLPLTIDNMEVRLQSNLDGQTYSASYRPEVEGTLLYNSIPGIPITPVPMFSNVMKYGFRSTAVNHNLVITGQFNLNTVVATYSIAGKR